VCEPLAERPAVGDIGTGQVECRQRRQNGVGIKGIGVIE
jgi:hypothetical protein